ncbi:hypothetical protein [Curtobacterium sp. MCBA15_007]|uniref:hypothetical protein n=1 Tax=Curtobacterium sp. MCBA15_007 TaxID=1898735 RepID=UPI000AAC6BFE|nr:hypothetical protein [Curtobacterium sp. MCBA15_007]
MQNKNRRVLLGGVAVAVVIGAGSIGTSAATAADTAERSVVAQAASVGTPAKSSAQPAAPVAVATALARGFTAAKAPQAVSQAARQGSFLQGLGFLASTPVNADASALQDAYFDR